jgi:hypothetical protein
MKNHIQLVLLFVSTVSLGQDMNTLVLTEDAKYFDFWEGNWFLVKEDNSLDTTSYFKIKRSVHPAAFTEEWNFAGKSIAIRAWDKTNSKWVFIRCGTPKK